MGKLNHIRAAVDSASLLGDSLSYSKAGPCHSCLIFQHNTQARSPVNVYLVAILLKIDVRNGSLSSCSIG